MLRPLLAVCLCFLFACSTNVKNKSQAVDQFIQTWGADYKPNDKAYVDSYKNYLLSVEEFYKDHKVESKFPHYLNSIMNASQIIAHQENTLPFIYKKEKRLRPESNPKDYELYKTRKITALHDRLFTEREARLKEELGEEVYKKLRDHYWSFNEKNKSQNLGFPL